MALRDRRLVNLLEFDKNFIRPAAKRLFDGSGRYLRDFAVSELIACSSWVRLGVRLDFFMMEDAVDLLVRRFQGLSADLNEHETTVDYLFDPNLHVLMSRSAVGWQTFLEPIAFTDGPLRDLLRAVFRSAMVADISLATSASAVTFVAYLARSPGTVVRFLNKPVQSSENSTLSVTVVMQGSAAAMSYIEQQSALFDRFGDAVNEARRLDDGIYEQLRQIGSWRLRLSNEATRDAFLAACRFALENADFRGPVVTQRLTEFTAAWTELSASDLNTDQPSALSEGQWPSLALLPSPWNEVTLENFVFTSPLLRLRRSSKSGETAFLERLGSSEKLYAFVEATERQRIRADLGSQPRYQVVELLERLASEHQAEVWAGTGQTNIHAQFYVGVLLLYFALLPRDDDASKEAANRLDDALAHPLRETSRGELLNARINLGRVLWTLASPRWWRNASFDRAEAAFLQAVELAGIAFTRDTATAQLLLGDLILQIGERTRNEDAFARAITMFRAAAEILTRERLPLHLALFQHWSGIALSTLGYMRNDFRWLALAAEAFRDALAVFSPERTPMYWAIAQHNLGTVLANLAQLDRGPAIIERALEAFREAHEVWPGGSHYSVEAKQAIDGLLEILRFRRARGNK